LRLRFQNGASPAGGAGMPLSVFPGKVDEYDFLLADAFPPISDNSGWVTDAWFGDIVSYAEK